MKSQPSRPWVSTVMVVVLVLAALPVAYYWNKSHQPAPVSVQAAPVKPTARTVAAAQPVAPNPGPSDPLPVQPKPRKQKPPIQDPKAREALQHVGADLAATEYWIGAINNPQLGKNERQDLIEDLNEDGFSNKKNPGLEDLPLIENRLALIELLAPSAMDEVNADAFQEAYKDLIKMRSKLTGLPDTVPNLRPR